LFSLLGTTFGGDGVNNFALPDLRSRTPIGQTEAAGRTFYPVGERAGEEMHALTAAETAYHSHNLIGVFSPDLTKNTPMPDGTVTLTQAIATDDKGNPVKIDMYTKDFAPKTAMAPAAVGMTGGEPHPNVMPYLALNVCISMHGPVPKTD
jgi:microcystin-dependent protein